MSSNPSNTASFGRRDTPPADTGAVPPEASLYQPGATPPKPASAALREELAPTASGARRSKRSRSQFVVFLNFLMALVVIAVIAIGLIFIPAKKSFERPGPLAADTTFVVKPNTGLAAISQELESQGLITNASVFAAGVRFQGNDAVLKAGEFAIKAHASMRDIMGVLESGKSILYSLTIPEGLTVEQALQRVSAMPELSGNMPAVMPAEGSLAADTQRFQRGMARQKIIDKMVADQKELVDSIWQTRKPDLPLADINEFVTLASIVEKETGVAAERPQVAAVFINRLNKGMRLQSDPTILYGLFGGKGRPADRAIYQSDIQKPTPYNTYVINGLPPTPIANPGRAALEAVANPADTDALYFVADGSGGHVFAATLAEHNKNVAAWRAIKKERGEQGVEGEAAPPQ